MTLLSLRVLAKVAPSGAKATEEGYKLPTYETDNSFAQELANWSGVSVVSPSSIMITTKYGSYEQSAGCSPVDGRKSSIQRHTDGGWYEFKKDKKPESVTPGQRIQTIDLSTGEAAKGS